MRATVFPSETKLIPNTQSIYCQFHAYCKGGLAKWMLARSPARPLWVPLCDDCARSVAVTIPEALMPVHSSANEPSSPREAAKAWLAERMKTTFDDVLESILEEISYVAEGNPDAIKQLDESKDSFPCKILVTEFRSLVDELKAHIGEEAIVEATKPYRTHWDMGTGFGLKGYQLEDEPEEVQRKYRAWNEIPKNDWDRFRNGSAAPKPDADEPVTADSAACPNCGKTYQGPFAETNLKRHLVKCPA